MKRYTQWCCVTHRHELSPHESGDWVSFTEANAEIERLRTALNRVRKEEQELAGVTYHIANDALAGVALEPSEQVSKLMLTIRRQSDEIRALRIGLGFKDPDALDPPTVKSTGVEPKSEPVNRYHCMRCGKPYSTITMLDAHEELCGSGCGCSMPYCKICNPLKQDQGLCGNYPCQLPRHHTGPCSSSAANGRPDGP